ncbi:MAG: cytochrome b [Stellaceae bacterium]
MPQPRDYGATAKLFHWATAALLAAQFAVGWLMPDIKRGMQPERLMNLHLSIGLVILALMTARCAWRLAHGAPPPKASLPVWQRHAARLVHLALYLLVFAMTASGWLFASMRGWEITLFGAVPVPRLVAQGSTLGRAVGAWHVLLSWVLLGVIGLHVAAALAHVFVFRDRVLRRMLPRLGT